MKENKKIRLKKKGKNKNKKSGENRQQRHGAGNMMLQPFPHGPIENKQSSS